MTELEGLTLTPIGGDVVEIKYSLRDSIISFIVTTFIVSFLL